MKTLIAEAVRACVRGKQFHYAILAVVVIFLPFLVILPEPKLIVVPFLMPLVVGIALYISADSIGKEIKNKRIDLIITRPVRRYEILYSRLIGTAAVFLVGLVACCAVMFIVLAVRGRALFTFSETLNYFVTALFLIGLNISIGVIVRKSPNWLVIIIAFIAYGIMSAVKSIPGLPSPATAVLDVMLYILPPFNRLNPATMYGFSWANLFFVLLYLCVALTLATVWFNRQEIARR
jgi:ABC-type Na+ efflux pump permease subunit